MARNHREDLLQSAVEDPANTRNVWPRGAMRPIVGQGKRWWQPVLKISGFKPPKGTKGSAKVLKGKEEEALKLIRGSQKGRGKASRSITERLALSRVITHIESGYGVRDRVRSAQLKTRIRDPGGS